MSDTTNTRRRASEDSRCDHENGLVERPASNQTPEQRWCGTWHDCPFCRFTTLTPSAELLAYRATVARVAD